MYLLFIPFVQFLQLTWDHLFFLIEIYDQLKGEWLLLNANSAISWREQFTFDEMMMMSALYYINMLSWLFIELAHWNKSTGRHVAPPRHIILILCHPVFALTPCCCMLSREATNYKFIIFGLTRLGLRQMIFHTRGS
jgi:hypothetical protein